MKPAAVQYYRPSTVADALSALAEDADAKLLAGGQSLIALMNIRLVRPSLLIDVGHLSELDSILEDNESIVMGAMVRHVRVNSNRLIRDKLPLLSEAAGHVGHLAIRNRGTLGGTLAHADPAAEIPLVAVTAGATFYVDSFSRGRREVAAADFFKSFYDTSLQQDEMLCWTRFPILRPREGWGFVEFARRHGDFALAGAAVLLCLAEDGRCASLRVGALGVGVTPLLFDIPSSVVDSQPDAGTWEALADELSHQAHLEGDHYRRQLLRTALERAFLGATARAQQSVEEDTRR